MNKDEYLIETLNSLRNEMSHIWGAVFVTGGGAITLFTTGYKGEKVIFIVLGLFFAIIFMNAYMIRRKEVVAILKKIKRGGQ
jgi:hypothetical protein